MAAARDDDLNHVLANSNRKKWKNQKQRCGTAGSL